MRSCRGSVPTFSRNRGLSHSVLRTAHYQHLVKHFRSNLLFKVHTGVFVCCDRSDFVRGRKAYAARTASSKTLFREVIHILRSSTEFERDFRSNWAWVTQNYEIMNRKETCFMLGRSLVTVALACPQVADGGDGLQ
jgi:hypothetical protein